MLVWQISEGNECEGIVAAAFPSASCLEKLSTALAVLWALKFDQWSPERQNMGPSVNGRVPRTMAWGGGGSGRVCLGLSFPIKSCDQESCCTDMQIHKTVFLSHPDRHVRFFMAKTKFSFIMEKPWGLRSVGWGCQGTSISESEAWAPPPPLSLFIITSGAAN